MAQKVEFEKEKKALIESAAEKELTLKKKLGTIGNIVHDSVPINNDEVMPNMEQLQTYIPDLAY